MGKTVVHATFSPDTGRASQFLLKNTNKQTTIEHKVRFDCTAMPEYIHYSLLEINFYIFRGNTEEAYEI